MPFIVTDDESDSVEVLIQWSIQPEASFPDLNDPALNPFVDSADTRYVGESVEDPDVRATVLADTAVHRALGLITEARAELRAIACAQSTLSRLVSPALNRLRPPGDLEGATVVIGAEGEESTAVASMAGLAIDFSPPLPPSADPVAGSPVCVKVAEVQGRGVVASPEGTLRAALWDCAADLPSDRTVAIRITAFDSQAGSAAESVRVDRRVRGNLVLSETAEAGDGPQALAAADLDGDGRNDIVVINIETGAAAIYIQDVDGITPEPNQQLDAGFAPDAQAIGDLNGGGRNDLAVSNDGEIGVPADDIIRIYLQE